MKRAKCLMMAVLAFTLSVFAADTFYTWTGTAGDGSMAGTVCSSFANARTPLPTF